MDDFASTEKPTTNSEATTAPASAAPSSTSSSTSSTTSTTTEKVVPDPNGHKHSKFDNDLASSQMENVMSGIPMNFLSPNLFTGMFAPPGDESTGSADMAKEDEDGSQKVLGARKLSKRSMMVAPRKQKNSGPLVQYQSSKSGTDYDYDRVQKEESKDDEEEDDEEENDEEEDDQEDDEEEDNEEEDEEKPQKQSKQTKREASKNELDQVENEARSKSAKATDAADNRDNEPTGENELNGENDDEIMVKKKAKKAKTKKAKTRKPKTKKASLDTRRVRIGLTQASTNDLPEGTVEKISAGGGRSPGHHEGGGLTVQVNDEVTMMTSAADEDDGFSGSKNGGPKSLQTKAIMVGSMRPKKTLNFFFTW